MTEAEWLTTSDLAAMTAFLVEATELFRTRWQGWIPVTRLRTTPRKLRLFAVACCRGPFKNLPADELRRLLDVSEANADGWSSDNDLQFVLGDALRFRSRESVLFPSLRRFEDEAVAALCRLHRAGIPDLGGISSAMQRAWNWAAMRSRLLRGAELPSPEASAIVRRAEALARADLLRDVVGNPFRTMIVDDAWLRWGDATVRKMAHGIYEDNAFGHMPILHDALLDAGCNDEAILEHCRNAAGHARGCWVID